MEEGAVNNLRQLRPSDCCQLSDGSALEDDGRDYQHAQENELVEESEVGYLRHGSGDGVFERDDRQHERE